MWEAQLPLQSPSDPYSNQQAVPSPPCSGLLRSFPRLWAAWFPLAKKPHPQQLYPGAAMASAGEIRLKKTNKLRSTNGHER